MAFTYKHFTVFSAIYAEEIAEKKLVIQIFDTWFKSFDIEIKPFTIKGNKDFSFTSTIIFELYDYKKLITNRSKDKTAFFMQINA